MPGHDKTECEGGTSHKRHEENTGRECTAREKEGKKTNLYIDSKSQKMLASKWAVRSQSARLKPMQSIQHKLTHSCSRHGRHGERAGEFFMSQGVCLEGGVGEDNNLDDILPQQENAAPHLHELGYISA